MSISQMLLPEFDQEMANTRKLLNLVPDDKLDYKPHEKSMTLGRLAGHVAELPRWASMTMSTELLDIQPGEKPYTASSRQQMIEDFDRFVAEARQSLAGATDEQFGQKWTLKFAGKEIFSSPRVAVLRGMVMNHLIHHRAQLGVYLRLNEVEFPGMYGPSADEAKFWSAESA